MFDRIASSLLDVFAPRGPTWNPTGLIAFRTVLLLHAAVRLWGRVAFDPTESPGWFSLALAGVATLAAGAGFVPKLARRAAGVAAVASLLDISTDFAQAANHEIDCSQCAG